MALSLTHQFGALSGKPISLDTGSTGNVSSDTTATFSAAAVWKSPPRASIRCRARRTSRGGSLTDIDIVSSPSSSSQPRSPHRSPSPVMSFRPDLALTCQAFATDERGMMMGNKNDEDESGVPVYVMMPLDTVTMMNTLNRKKAMSASLQALKSAGVTGVMVDVWWGLVERDHPGKYNWGGYVEFFDMAKMYGLKVQAVMSFHQCGGNVGDTVTIPLPNWALEEMNRDNDLAYTDQWGRRNFEYVSLGCDHLKVLKGRTPIECYADFMRAFRDNFKHLLGETIVEIQVGMGPAGELRYPSYPEKDGIWRFPGIGAFQCFDKYMLQSLKSAAESAGKPEWGHSGPTDAGSYNNWPEDTTFFRRENGGWNTKYGEFFLKWYSNTLLNHGDLILTQANSIFNNVTISAKVAGIHWHYGTRSHAAELTAGYYNTRYTDGYKPIAKLLAKHGVVLNFTCVEMRDHEQPQDAQCLPEKLVRQVATASKETGVEFAGENALQRYDEYAHEQILKAAAGEKDLILSAFTYLRMNPELFKEEHWRKFVGFVRKMKETGGNEKNKNKKKKNKCKEEMERDADRFVHVTPQPFMQEAGVALMH